MCKKERERGARDSDSKRWYSEFVSTLLGVVAALLQESGIPSSCSSFTNVFFFECVSGVRVCVREGEMERERGREEGRDRGRGRGRREEGEMDGPQQLQLLQFV
jgi:hypothetical protein